MYTELSLTVRIDMTFHKEKCCFLYWKNSSSHFFMIFFFGIANCHSIQRIKECGITCSQGVHCKNKPAYDVLYLFCRPAPDSLSPRVLENMKISTVMLCTQTNQCTLHLNVIGTVIPDENIRGLEICSMAFGSQQNQCMNIRLMRSKLKKSHVQKVIVLANCFEVGVSEHVYVTMKTVPHYCGVELAEQYRVEDCHNKDVGKHILSCQSGKLDYMVNEGKKTITVHVSGIREDFDYNVRLCLKQTYSCHDIGAHALIKKDNSTKSVMLPYSEIIPCLCIEGWSAIPDSRRTRFCPFKNDFDRLWDSITYNPITQVLSWKSSCPVNAIVSLCWMTDETDNEKCVYIPNSETEPGNQASYTQVDTHPRLCMKFTTDVGSWVKCVFAAGQFSAWDMKIHITDETVQIRLASPAKAKFSLFICNRTKFNSCEPLQMYALVYVGASDHVTLNFSRDICSPNICIQNLRVDVNYSFPVQICDIPCNHNSALTTATPKGEPITTKTKPSNPPKILEDTLIIEDGYICVQMLIVAAVGMVLTVVFTLVGYMIIKVWHQKKMQKKTLLKSKIKHLSGIASSLELQATLLINKTEGD